MCLSFYFGSRDSSVNIVTRPRVGICRNALYPSGMFQKLSFPQLHPDRLWNEPKDTVSREGVKERELNAERLHPEPRIRLCKSIPHFPIWLYGLNLIP